MLFNVALTFCISSILLVFPYEKPTRGKPIYGKPTHGRLTRENPIHGKSNIPHHKNLNSPQNIPQENHCKAHTSQSKQSSSCQAKAFQDVSIVEMQKEALAKVEALQHDESFQEFQKKAIVNRDEVLKSETFHADITAFKKPLKENVENPEVSSKSALTNPGELYIFVSFSLGEKALLNLANDAKQFGAALVLRGLVDGSYVKTAKALQAIIQETEQGFIIDPELFSLFAIQAVPTFILAKPFQLQASDRTQTPLHDRLQGHVSARYVLEAFAKEGDLKDEATSLLLRGKPK